MMFADTANLRRGFAEITTSMASSRTQKGMIRLSPIKIADLNLG